MTKNAALADKNEVTVITANFRKLLKKEGFLKESSEVDREEREIKMLEKIATDKRILEEESRRQTAALEWQKSNLTPGQVLQSLNKAESEKLVNFATLGLHEKKANRYVNHCVKDGLVPSSALIGLNLKTRCQGVWSHRENGDTGGVMSTHQQFLHEFVLDLTGQHQTTARAVKRLVPMLHTKKDIIILKLSDSPMKVNAANMLFDALPKQCPNITEIHVNNCSLGELGGKEVAKYLRVAPSLKKLYIQKNQLKDGFCKAFAISLGNNEISLEELDLGDNGITWRGGEYLADAFACRGRSIMSLLMAWNNLGDRGVDKIAKAFIDLGKSAMIGRIDFSYNNLTDLIGESLPKMILCSHMNVYNVSHNQLGPIYAGRLRSGLDGPITTCTMLDVSYNPLGTFETAHIIETVKSNKIVDLKICNCVDLNVGGDEDMQYVYELATRVSRAKDVLFMMRKGRKKKISIEIEFPPKKRTQRSKLINSMMGWMKKKRKHMGITEWSGGSNNVVNHGEDWHSLQMEDDDVKVTKKKNAPESKSVFHDRIKNCDSHSYWDTQQVNGMAFEEDWVVLDHTKIVKPRMSKKEERLVHDLLKDNFILLRELFMFYAATGNKRMKNEFAVNMYGMHDFVKDCQVVCKQYTSNDVDMTFLQAALNNKEEDKEFIKAQRKEFYHKNVVHTSKTDEHHLNADILRLSQHMKMQQEVFREHAEEHEANENHDRAVEEMRKLQALKHQKAQKKKDDTKANVSAQTLTRTEWLEYILRIAIDRYFKSNEAKSPSEAVQMLLENNIIPNAFIDIDDYARSMFFDRNRFRDEKLYFRQVDEVFREYFLELQAIYGFYSLGEHFAFEGKLVEQEEMDMIEFWNCMKSMQSKPVWDLIRSRDVKLAYNFSQMASVKDPDVLGIKSDFVEFLEGISRLADMTYGRGLPDALQPPLSDKLRKIIPNLIEGNESLIKKFSSRMTGGTKTAVNTMHAGNAGWQSETRSKMVDQLMNWKMRGKEKADVVVENDTPT